MEKAFAVQRLEDSEAHILSSSSYPLPPLPFLLSLSSIPRLSLLTTPSSIPYSSPFPPPSLILPSLPLHSLPLSSFPLLPFPLPSLSYRSQGQTCGICMDIVVEKVVRSDRRFGILCMYIIIYSILCIFYLMPMCTPAGCDHCFCLGCIRKWRNSTHINKRTIRYEL